MANKNSRGHALSNPFDLDFSPWSGADVKELRKSLWASPAEIRSHKNYAKTHPTCADMAKRVGVFAEQWGRWEREGIQSIGWAALLRIYADEGRDITPINCSIESLDACVGLLGNYTELAQALGVDRRTITKWRYSIGYVPGVLGYGRIVRIVFEDLIQPVKSC